MTDRDRRAVMLAIYAAIVAGSFALGELVFLVVRWAIRH